MTRDELIVFIDRYVRNSAVDAFTNDRLNTILKQIIASGVSQAFDTFTEFRAAFEATPDVGIRAFVGEDDEFGNDEVIYEYIPGVGIMLAGLELVEDLRT